MLIISSYSLSEITRIQSGGKPPGRDTKFVDIYHEKPIRLTVRALVPVREHPKVSTRSKTVPVPLRQIQNIIAAIFLLQLPISCLLLAIFCPYFFVLTPRISHNLSLGRFTIASWFFCRLVVASVDLKIIYWNLLRGLFRLSLVFVFLVLKMAQLSYKRKYFAN